MSSIIERIIEKQEALRNKDQGCVWAERNLSPVPVLWMTWFPCFPLFLPPLPMSFLASRIHLDPPLIPLFPTICLVGWGFYFVLGRQCLNYPRITKMTLNPWSCLYFQSARITSLATTHGLVRNIFFFFLSEVEPNKGPIPSTSCFPFTPVNQLSDYQVRLPPREKRGSLYLHQG